MIKTKALNHVDLCFAIDTTGSMGSFIHEAQQHLLDTLSLLSSDSSIDLQVGLVEYRDHPPQDESFITRVYPLTGKFKEMQKKINKLKADGGGDGPEAVYRGVFDACDRTKWRPHSCRFVLLVGDAPPHGFGAWLQTMKPDGKNRRSRYDAWPEGCPSGLDVQAVTAAAEKNRVTVHALCMRQDTLTMEAFGAIATATGGQRAASTNASEVISQTIDVLAAEFKDLEFDGRVLETAREMKSLDSAEVAEKLACPRLQVARAIARLGKRGFFDA